MKSSDGISVQKHAGVYVVEQVKEVIPVHLKDAVMLNLFHGVGVKSIERKLDSGFLHERIVKKYITNCQYYKNNQLFLVTSPMMEEHFKEYCGIPDDNVIRAGYPRCEYQTRYMPIQTFNHDLRSRRGMPGDCTIAMYAPTYRDQEKGSAFFRTALPDMDRLVQRLEELNMLLVVKMHPLIYNTGEYQRVAKAYGDCPNLMFWNNEEDVYEVLHQVQLGIVDYSSIYYDMLACGVSEFIRYFYDIDQDTVRYFARDPREMTSGKLCNTFDELLGALGDSGPCRKDVERITELFWSYAGEDTFETIINQTLSFIPVPHRLPELHSFDIFDTLITRKVLDPKGIFSYVQEKMKSSGNFDSELVERYPDIRGYAEDSARLWQKKTLAWRGDNRREISFEMIFQHIQESFDLSEFQINLLKAWELEAELENCVPVAGKIAQARERLAQGDTVVLISDMYLGIDFIRSLLRKADSSLENLPLYLSSDLGVQKTTRKLFLEVFHSFEDYSFSKWVHHGDNEIADSKQPLKLGIHADLHAMPRFNEYEQRLVDSLGTYDAYLLAAQLARFRSNNCNDDDYYSYAYVSAYFVPYIEWVLQDAVDKGFQTLYFISRDGYHLKRIADVVIEHAGLPVKTRYIYGSRRAWRIPSFIDDIDDEFFSAFGNLSNVRTWKSLLKALDISENDFSRLFPEYKSLKAEEIDAATAKQFRLVASASQEYREYLLERASVERELVCAYLRQEIDFSEKYAVVEYWGRGYTQTCHRRLMDVAAGEERDLPYYYLRSILKTEGRDIRYNFTLNTQSLLHIEALFANMPHKSVEGYEVTEEGTIVPVLKSIPCDMNLFNSMERVLVQVTQDFLDIDFLDRSHLMSAYLDFGLKHAAAQDGDSFVAERLGRLVDSVNMYGAKREFAPAVTADFIAALEAGEKESWLTSSIEMSLARSTPEGAAAYADYLERRAEKRKRRRERKERAAAKAAKEKAAEIEAHRRSELAENVVPLYRSCIQLPVNNQIVLLAGDAMKGSLFIEGLRRKLGQNAPCHVVFSESTYSQNDIRLLAEASVVLALPSDELLSCVPLRPETKVVRLSECTCEYVINPLREKTAEREVGLAQGRRGTYGLTGDCYPAASELEENILRHKLSKDSRASIMLTGNPVTDAYFDERVRVESKERIASLFPQAGDKQVIVYMPQDRTRRNHMPMTSFLDFAALEEAVGDTHVLLVHGFPEGMEQSWLIPESCSEFARDVTGVLDARDALCAADVVVGDYRDVFMESALLDRPVFQTTEDLASFENDNETWFSLVEHPLGPCVYDTHDLAERIKHIDTYDYGAVRAFRKFAFSECDGGSASRIFQEL